MGIKKFQRWILGRWGTKQLLAKMAWSHWWICKSCDGDEASPGWWRGRRWGWSLVQPAIGAEPHVVGDRDGDEMEPRAPATWTTMGTDPRAAGNGDGASLRRRWGWMRASPSDERMRTGFSILWWCKAATGTRQHCAGAVSFRARKEKRAQTSSSVPVKSSSGTGSYGIFPSVVLWAKGPDRKKSYTNPILWFSFAIPSIQREFVVAPNGL